MDKKIEKEKNSLDSNRKEKEQNLNNDSKCKNILTRKTHLKDKINQMHFDENILSGIIKELNNNNNR